MPYHPSRLIRAVEHGTDWSIRISKPLSALPNRDIEELLARPTWSVYSLLPPTPQPKPAEAAGISKPRNSQKSKESVAAAEPEDEVTRDKLHHLLKLSALPLPKSAAEESRLLSSLRAQIHFVKAIQSVDTSHVTPLVAIRDETTEAVEEQTVRLEDLKQWLDLEEKVGENGTVRRKRVERESKEGKIGEGGWDPFQLGIGSEEGSGRRVGRWFVVKKAKGKDEAVKGRQAGRVPKRRKVTLMLVLDEEGTVRKAMNHAPALRQALERLSTANRKPLEYIRAAETDPAPSFGTTLCADPRPAVTTNPYTARPQHPLGAIIEAHEARGFSQASTNS